MGIDNKIGISRVVPCLSGMSRGLPIVYAELIDYVFPLFVFFKLLFLFSAFYGRISCIHFQMLYDLQIKLS